MPETVERRWISYEEATEAFGLGRTSLWKLVGAGHVPAARVGRRVLIDRAGLDAYLENLAQEGRREM